MIIKMAKVEIIGPKQHLMAVLEVLRGKGVFHPESDIHGFVPFTAEHRVRELLLDEAAVGEKLFFLRLREQIGELLNCLPDLQVRTSYLQPLPIVDVIGELVKKHLAKCRDLARRHDALQEQIDEIVRQLEFWQALEPLLPAHAEGSSLAFFGVRIRDPAYVEMLRTLLEERSAGRCQLSTAQAADGSRVGLLVAEPSMEKMLRRLLADEQVPELSLPDDMAHLPFWQRSAVLRERVAGLKEQVAQLSAEQETFARHWLPIYRQFLVWLDERISLYQATAAAYETRQCFFIHGWMVEGETAALQTLLGREFSGQVVLRLLEVQLEDLDRVPVMLKNPFYFRPFELFARLLPLPRYSSYDPTPFLGLFFPLLFGMILGDIGYGVLLGLVAGMILLRYPHKRDLCDGARILGVSAASTILFGVIYGEFFGSLGARLFNLHPLWLERSEAIVPMICFAIGVGVAHVLFGLVLGIVAAMRRGKRREALVKFVTLLLLGLWSLWGASLLLPEPWRLTLPLILSLVVLVPALIVAGGLLAPLELLKSFGNIISYVRIMAIGLSSVLLAKVANQLGGMSGDFVAGVLVAGILHFFNLVLGVFAPTVHSLRLHYVEFFSKFLEFGGREFRPLKKGK